jgi:hypothetical protein
LATMDQTDLQSDRSLPLVEIGWLVAGKLEPSDAAASEVARDDLQACLVATFPQFRWRFSKVERPEIIDGFRVEAVKLLDHGVVERNLRTWDYTIIITGSQLVGHYRPDPVAAVSRSLQGVVVSTAQLDPQHHRADASEEERRMRMASRLKAVALHALGHQLGLGHQSVAENVMSPLETTEDIDAATSLAPEQIEEMANELSDVADRRLEETGADSRHHPLRFYLRSAWHNRQEIASAVLEARPWEFPYRLSRLTTAAISALLVLVVTAEVWSLALVQPPLTVWIMALVSNTFTTVFVLMRQKLLLRRERSRLTEQTVMTNLSTLAIVCLGMLTTFGCLLALGFLTSLAFVTPELARAWIDTPSASQAAIGWTSYGKLVAFAASLAVCIGALGASFEDNYYFRHVTFVDEEI